MPSAWLRSAVERVLFGPGIGGQRRSPPLRPYRTPHVTTMGSTVPVTGATIETPN